MVADLLEPGEQRRAPARGGSSSSARSIRSMRVADEGLVEHDLLAGQADAGGRSRSWPAARARCRGRTCGGAAGTGRSGRRTGAPWSARAPTRSAPAHTLRKALRLPSSPGVAQSRIAHSSVRLFSTGVPVSATRAALGIGAQRPGGRGAGVLDVLGLVGDDQVPRRPRRARGVVAHRAVRREHEPRRRAPRRASSARPPWKRRTGTPGANRSISASQLPSRLPGRPRASARARAEPPSVPVQVERDQGDRLAEAHVVGQAGAEAERR